MKQRDSAKGNMLLDLLRPLELGAPQMQLDPFQRLEKPGWKRPRGKRRRSNS